MTETQQIKNSFRILNQRNIKTLGPGTLTKILAHESRLMNGAPTATEEQYQTVTAPYIRRPG